MTDITLKGNSISTHGSLPEVGTKAPDFQLVGTDLEPVSLSDFQGKKVVLNIFQSLDTDTCANSVRRFNELATELDDTVVLCISRDLPFAQKRFCGAEGIENVVVASDFRTNMGEDYGVTMINGPLEGLMARSVVVLDADGTVAYTEQVSEISHEPDYDKALEAVKSA